MIPCCGVGQDARRMMRNCFPFYLLPYGVTDLSSRSSYFLHFPFRSSSPLSYIHDPHYLPGVYPHVSRTMILFSSRSYQHIFLPIVRLFFLANKPSRELHTTSMYTTVEMSIVERSIRPWSSTTKMAIPAVRCLVLYQQQRSFENYGIVYSRYCR